MKPKLLLLLCMVTLGLASCKKDTIIEETQNKTVIFDIQPTQWKLSTDGKTYSYQYTNLPEIDDFGLRNEGTLMYISYPNSSGAYTTYAQLPFVYNVDAYSYEAYNGGVNVLIQSSDLQASAPIRPNTTVRIKVVIITSRNVT